MTLPAIEWTEHVEREMVVAYGASVRVTHRVGRIPLDPFDAANPPPYLRTIVPHADGRLGFKAPGLIGRVNRRPVKFANHIALAETLLFSIVHIGVLADTTAHWAYAELAWRDLRGVCEDGQVHFVGWNRLYNPTAEKWLRVRRADDDATGIYEYAEDVGGFEQIWGGAPCLKSSS